MMQAASNHSAESNKYQHLKPFFTMSTPQFPGRPSHRKMFHVATVPGWKPESGKRCNQISRDQPSASHEEKDVGHNRY